MKLLKVLVFLLVFGAGTVLGILINDFPLIQFNPEIRLFEPLSFVLTALIGILIPFFIKRLIDDNRQIKNNLTTELKDLLKEVERVSDKIKFCHKSKAITQKDKEETIMLFEFADLKYHSMEQQLTESYNSETKLICTEIHAEYINYWKFVTGAELMASKFKIISDEFLRNHNEYFMTFETIVKKAINKVHRL